MYLKISKFLLSHEYLNMNKVPGFYQFFYSSDFEVMLLKSPRSPRVLRWAVSPCWHSGIFPLGTVGGTVAQVDKQCWSKKVGNAKGHVGSLGEARLEKRFHSMR